MENNLNILYREIIMEHSKNPRNKGLKDGLDIVRMKNPICGDDISIQVKLNNGVIQNVYHDGSGCAISRSACSVMSETVKGKTIEEAKNIVQNYVKMTKGESFDKNIDMGDAIVYEGVAKFPARFKCATIAWEGLLKALENKK